MRLLPENHSDKFCLIDHRAVAASQALEGDE